MKRNVGLLNSGSFQERLLKKRNRLAVEETIGILQQLESVVMEELLLPNLQRNEGEWCLGSHKRFLLGGGYFERILYSLDEGCNQTRCVNPSSLTPFLIPYYLLLAFSGI